MESLRFIVIAFMIAILLPQASCQVMQAPAFSGQCPIHMIASQGESESIYHGGTVDRIIVTQYLNLTSALAAVDTGEADVFGHRINATDYGIVGSYSSLRLQWAYDILGCMLVINSRMAPLNDSHLRRAMAFAANKTWITSTAMHGEADPIDFALPLCNEFSIEKNEGGLFYDANLGSAMNELAMAGMLDVDNDSLVEAPNGTEISFTLWYPNDTEGMNETAAIISANLLSSGINNTIVPMEYAVLQDRIQTHNESFSLALYHQTMDEYGFEWIATTFLSSMREVDGENVANIDDSRLNQLAWEYMDNILLDQARAIGLEAVRVVRDLCPIIPLFAYRWLSVYNDARFQGWVNDSLAGAFGPWNPVSITARTGMPNEMRIAVLPAFFDSFFCSLNLFRTGIVINSDWISKRFFNPYLLVYDSSLETTLDGRAVPRLATSWEMLYLGLVPDLNASQCRTQFYIDPNALWTDGVAVDAQDYRFTLECYANSSVTAYSNLLAGVKTLGDYVAGINYDDLDMFSFRLLGALPILPRHVWEGKNPLNWEPNVQDAIGSGPFKVLSFEPNSSLVLTTNSEYYPVLDTEAPKLKSFYVIPGSPTPAETVVLRAYIEDRSRIRNVMLHYTYRVGSANFSYSSEMELGALGYQGTIPARVTATTVNFEINATDIWGNSAIVVSGYYSRPTTTINFWQTLTPYVIVTAVALASVILAFILKRRK